MTHTQCGGTEAALSVAWQGSLGTGGVHRLQMLTSLCLIVLGKLSSVPEEERGWGEVEGAQLGTVVFFLNRIFKGHLPPWILISDFLSFIQDQEFRPEK